MFSAPKVTYTPVQQPRGAPRSHAPFMDHTTLPHPAQGGVHTIRWIDVGAQKCVAPYFRLSTFARQQIRWRAEKRFLTYCGDGTGLGSWLRGLAAAVAAAILSERALTIGDARSCTLASAGAVPEYLPRYFRAKGWSSSRPFRTKADRARDVLVTLERRKLRTYNRAFVHGVYVGNASVQLRAGYRRGADRIFGDSPLLVARFAKILGWPDFRADWWTTLHSCAYSYTLHPTHKMLLLERDFYGRHNITFDNTTGIPRFKVLHAWLDEGGAADARNGSARNPSTSTFARDPAGALACFDQLGGDGTPTLLSDSPWATSCAAAAGVATTDGVASATAPLEKPLLDWWLMVRAENISALQNRSSPLLETAWLRGGREGAYPTAFWEPCGAGVGRAVECPRGLS